MCCPECSDRQNCLRFLEGSLGKKQFNAVLAIERFYKASELVIYYTETALCLHLGLIASNKIQEVKEIGIFEKLLLGLIVRVTDRTS